MKLKYQLDRKDKKTVLGRTVYRIKALKAFANVHIGDKGGYIESMCNLSQNGDCWVYDKAVVCGEGYVFDNATVRNRAIISGGLVYDKARVGDDTVMTGGSVWGNTSCLGYARIEVGNSFGGDSVVRLAEPPPEIEGTPEPEPSTIAPVVKQQKRGDRLSIKDMGNGAYHWGSQRLINYE